MLNNKGFTLIEMVLVIAVVAFTTALAFPTAMEMFDNRRLNEEKASLEELDEIFRIYFWENKEIPLGTSIEAFANETSTTSVLNYRGIVEDAFEKPRFYQSATSTVQFNGADIETYYAFIYSTGVNGCMGLDSAICSVDDISATLNAWWARDLDPARAFETFEADEGDFILKFSTQGDSGEAYNTTIERLRRLGDALEEYNKLQGYHALANDVTITEVFFPPSQGVDFATTYDKSESDIAAELDAADLFGGGQDVITTDDANADDHMDRRMSMIALARLIGLPDEYCCHPLSYFDFDADGDGVDEKYEQAFFYYASPRVNMTGVGGGAPPCGPSPSVAEKNYLPARIAVTKDECGNPF